MNAWRASIDGGLVIRLSLAVPSRQGVPSRGSFAHWAGLALPAPMRRGELSIRVVDTDEGRALNRRWRGRDYATNVLSFPAAPVPAVGPRLFGDLVLCAPVVQAEAARQGIPARHHWAHLTIHGVLHLVGHDHERPKDADKMQAIERKLLARLGIPDPYALPSATRERRSSTLG